MNKTDFLKQVEDASLNNLVTEKELVSVFRKTKSNKSLETKKSISNLIYIVAGVGAFFILGWVLYIASLIWEDTGVLTHLAMTLGIGFLMYAFGNYYLMYRNQKFVGMGFEVLAAFLLPFGFSILGAQIGSGFVASVQIFIALVFSVILFGLYVFPNLIIKNVLYYLISTIYISSIYYFFVALVLEIFNISFDIYVSAFVFTIYGFVMLAVSKYLEAMDKDKLSIFVKVIGLASIVLSNYALVFDNSIFNITQILIVLYLFFLAIYRNSKILFYAAVGNLLLYVLYLFFKLFEVNSAIALLAIGVVLIALSFGISKLHKRVFKD